MSIWIDKTTKVIVQGITGEAGTYHTQEMLGYGTNIVAGVTPGKGGTKIENIPVFDTMEEAVDQTGGNVSIIYVPARFAADAILEGVDAELDMIVCITEHIPIKDMIMVKKYMEGKKTRLIGPNCPGIITPGKCKIGIMPGYIHKEGKIGVVSRSGTLTYEAVHQLTQRGIGQSAAVGIGGDPINGTDFIDVLKAFEEDDETDGVVMIGEIGGNAEESAAIWIKENMTKPVVGFISGVTAPEGKRMGHAGAIISSGKGTADEKIRIMKESGIYVAKIPTAIGDTLVKVLKEKNLWRTEYEV